MSINTTLYQTSPYFDDYETSGNEAKGHLKVLFKPGTSVQARELNQLQTLLQTQIDRFGSHIFEDGSRVLDGDLTIDGNLFFIDVTFSDTDLKVDGSTVTAADVLSRVGLLKNIDHLIGNNSPETVGMSAEITDFEALVTTDEETTYRLYLKYTKRTETTISFERNQTIRSQTAINSGGAEINLGDEIGTVSKTGFATKLHIAKGVYFVSGHFVNVEESEVIVERSSETKRITGQLAFKISEQIKTSIDDSTLLDNATGAPNTSAPGADRYAITLSLVVRSDQSELLDIPYNNLKVFNLTTTDSTEFIPLVTLEDGREIPPLSTKYASKEGRLGTTLAKRTHEESGNYCLDKILISTREAYNDGGNNGKYASTETSEINELKSQYVVDVSPGIIYVEGQRIEIKNQFGVLQEKARDSKLNESISFNSGLGTYIEGTFSDATIPDFEDNNSPVSSYVVQGSSPETTIIPTGIERVSGAGLSTIYRLYFNLETASYQEVNAATNITDDTVSPSAVFTPSKSGTTFTVRGNKQSSKVVALPKRLVSGVRANSTTFAIRKEFKGTGSGSGDYGINVTSLGSGTIILQGLTTGETFTSVKPNDYIVSNGTTFATVSAVTLNAARTTATLTVNVTSGTITAAASVFSTLTQANKTLVTGHVVSNVNSPVGITTGEVIQLGVSDVIEITSIVGGDANSPEQTIVLDDFVLDNGQRDNSYENATLTYIGEATLDGNVTITLNHFTHGSGQYFSRNSYPTTFDYAKIPSYKGIRLADAFDFRGSGGAELDPNTTIETVVDYYLPRYDQLVVTRRGEFELIKGVSSKTPTPPETPSGSMALYNLFLPAFTFNARAIKQVYMDHSRFTMRDIGQLEKRIKNLEYYTSLSLLERDAKDKDIFDDAGERFKNGIFVDSFTGHGRAEVLDPKHVCAIDYLNGHLRPSVNINQVEVKVDNTQTEKIVRLPSVSEETIIEQSFASVSESVIPYHVSNSYSGTLQLSPTGDDWVETRRRPNVTENTDHNYDNLTTGSSSENSLNTVWSNSTVEVVPGDRYVTVEYGNSHYITKVFLEEDTLDLDEYPTESDSVRSAPNQSADRNVSGRTYRRSGSSGIGGNTANQTFGRAVRGSTSTETTIIPFIKSRKVAFRATGMKPNTRLYSYFDEVNISAYTSNLNAPLIGGGTYTAGAFASAANHNQTSRIDFYDKSPAGAMTALSTVRQEVVTDDNGMVEGFFVIPNTSSIHFPVGKRNVVFTDTNGGVYDGNLTTRCSSFYTVTSASDNNLDNVDGNTKITRRPQDGDVTGTEPPVIVPSQTGIGDTPTGEIAIAGDGLPEYNLTVDKDQIDEGQTFTVTLNTKNVADGNVAYTISGASLSDFSGESALTGNLVVSNGVATKKFSVRIDNVTDESDVITFSLDVDPASHFVSVTVDDIVEESEDAEGNVSTRFITADDNLNGQYNREDPLAQSFHLADANIPRGAYIKSLDLYFETKPTTNEPVRVQIVEVENGIPTSRVVKHGFADLNPGSVNVSSNSSTATTFTFDNPVYLDAEREYAFVVRSSSKDYKVWMSEFGQNDKVSGQRISRDPYLGIAFRSTNASTWIPVPTRDIKFKLNAHIFLSSSESSRTRAVGPGTVSETGTGSFRSLVTSSFTASSAQFRPSQRIHPKTDISYSLVAGGNTINLSPTGIHNYFGSAVSVTSATNLRLVASLTTSDRFLTPTIDLDKLSLICYGNVINDDETNETNAAHGNATARYVSKKIMLNNPADKLSVFLGVNRPKGSNVSVYVRFDSELSSPQILDCRDSDWTELESNSILESLGEDEPTSFEEIEYDIDPTNDFSQFQLKIVMTSSDTSKVPVVTDLRAISTV